ncbi:MAG: hypothetical protein H8D78_19140 [Chloroflexi bacterium]|nr:hypothetical protein [Chloroflexota bacterium]
MPSERTHHRLVQHNRDFLGTFALDTTPYRDWAVTVMFYAALHLVECYLARKDLHPSDHTVRDAYLQRTAGLKPIWTQYRRLKDESQSARYEGATFTAAEAQRLRTLLAEIEAHITTLLSKQSSPPVHL